jgi:hypothetical protein
MVDEEIKLNAQMEQFLKDLTECIAIVVPVNDNLRNTLRLVLTKTYTLGFNEALKLLKESGHINLH